VRGIDDRLVEPNRETKSVGAEDTFAEDLTHIEEMESELEKIVRIVYKRLQAQNLRGRTITLKIKYGDFKQITRSRSFSEPVDDFQNISQTACKLLRSTEPINVKVRLLGIYMSNFGEIKHELKRTEDVLQ